MTQCMTQCHKVVSAIVQEQKHYEILPYFELFSQYFTKFKIKNIIRNAYLRIFIIHDFILSIVFLWKIKFKFTYKMLVTLHMRKCVAYKNKHNFFITKMKNKNEDGKCI